MRVLMLVLLLICSQSLVAQETPVEKVEVAKVPENDGSTERAPIDEGGGPGKDEERRLSALERVIQRATEEKPFKVRMNTLKSLELRDGKKINTSDIVEVSLDEDRKIETVELKDSQIVHRLDVETATVKPNPILLDTVAVKPEKIQFTFTPPTTTTNTNRDAVMAEMRRIILNSSAGNGNASGIVDFNQLPMTGSGSIGGSIIRVMGVDGGGRSWYNDTESRTYSDTPFRVKIGVDGGGITH